MSNNTTNESIVNGEEQEEETQQQRSMELEDEDVESYLSGVDLTDGEEQQQQQSCPFD